MNHPGEKIALPGDETIFSLGQTKLDFLHDGLMTLPGFGFGSIGMLR
jgi:ribosomal protein L27